MRLPSQARSSRPSTLGIFLLEKEKLLYWFLDLFHYGIEPLRSLDRQILMNSNTKHLQNISHFSVSFNITYTNRTHDCRFDHLKGWFSSNKKSLWKVKTSAKSCPNLLFLTLFYQEMNNIQLQQLQQEEATRIRLNQNVNKLEHQVQNLTTVSSVWSRLLNQQHFSYGDEANW